MKEVEIGHMQEKRVQMPKGKRKKRKSAEKLDICKKKEHECPKRREKRKKIGHTKEKKCICPIARERKNKNNTKNDLNDTLNQIVK